MQSSDRKYIDHYSIFNFWKDKCIDKYGNIKDNVPENFDGTEEVIIDWGEPDCWCCRKPILVEKKEPHYQEWIDNDDLKSIWNSRTAQQGLQKAHIIPKMLGGTEEPQNMFLLCSTCHKNSPDLDNPRMFLSYVFRTRKEKKAGIYSPFFEAMRILREDYGIEKPIFTDEKTHIGFHQGVSESTYIYQLVSDALKNQTALKEELEQMFKKYLQNKIEELNREISANIGDVSEKQNKRDVYTEVLGSYEAFKAIEQGAES